MTTLPQSASRRLRQSRTLRGISLFMLAYAAFTILVSLPTLALGTFAAAADLVGIFVLLLGIYGLTAASLMLKAQHELNRRTLSATRWTRAAMAVAVPGSAITGFVAAIALFIAVDASWGSPPMIAVGWLCLLVVLASVANVLVLVRVLFTDLDELLWEKQVDRAAFDEGLNFVEFDSAPTPDGEAEEEQRQEQVEVVGL